MTLRMWTSGWWRVTGLLVCAVLGCEQGAPVEEGVQGQGKATQVGDGPGDARRSEDLPKIVAFGDSLTAGAGVAAEEAYPAQLQRRLKEQGYAYRVVNAGVSGDTTAGGLRRVDWVLKSRPQIVILELGANDGLRGLPIEQIRANLEAIITRLRAGGAKVVLAGMKLPLNYGEDYRAEFEAVYRDLARAYELTFMPFFLEGVGADARLNQADGIHPTGNGYRVIVDHLWPVLEPMLDQTTPVRLGTGGEPGPPVSPRSWNDRAGVVQDFLKKVS